MASQNNKAFLLYLIITLLVFIQAIPAHANIYSNNKITQKEKAVFAFFKALGSSPDYDYWIKSNPSYRSLPDKSKERYLLSEKLRLGGGYGSFDRNIDLLELRINVSAKYIPAKNGEKARVLFEFFDSSDNYIPTFNYPYANDSLSLVVNSLASFSDMALNEKQNQAVLKKIPYEDEDFDATLTLHVRVSRANYRKPISEKPVKQWLMIGEIAYLKCDVNSYKEGNQYMLWDYVAPWYEEIFRIKNMPEEEKYPHPFDLFKD